MLSKPPVRQPSGALKYWRSTDREAIGENDEIRVPSDWTPRMRCQLLDLDRVLVDQSVMNHSEHHLVRRNQRLVAGSRLGGRCTT